MSEHQERQKKINQQLIEEINHKDESVVLDALKKIRSIGHPDLIEPLLEKWIKSSGEVETQLTDLLYSLKDTKSVAPLISALQNKKFTHHRDKIVSIFWNAGLEPKDDLSVFVKIAIDGNFMEALECLTLIENLEPPFSEEQLMDSLLLLKEYFASNPNEDDQKYTLLRTIATIIKFTDDHQID